MGTELDPKYDEFFYEKRCPECKEVMEGIGTTEDEKDCNHWLCPKCGYVEAEIGSFKLNNRDEEPDGLTHNGQPYFRGRPLHTERSSNGKLV